MALSSPHNHTTITHHEESRCDSDESSIVSDVFSDNKCDEDSASEDLEDDECDDNPANGLQSEDEDAKVENAFEEDTHDPGQLSPAEYLAKAKQLNVSQLRQDRYADKTRGALTRAREDWERWVVSLGLIRMSRR
jgi:hypothetical protein